MSVFINVSDSRWNKYKVDFESIVKKALILSNKGSDVSVTLTNDKEIQKLNKEYRGLNKPTNVLSFETEDSDLLGDVFISFDTTMREAGEKEFINHVTHLVIHGVLHLQGFDHIKNKDAKVMELKEIEILHKMGIKNPYEDEIVVHKKIKLKSILERLGIFMLGTIGVFGFAPWHFWWATALSLGVAYWMMTKDNKKVSKLFWWGAGYGIANFHWSLESIFANAELAKQLWYFYPIGLVGLAIGSGIIFLIPFWMTKKTNSVGWSRTVYFALAWTFVLWLREWLLTGFPWNPIANISLTSIHVSNLMSIGGALGLTFILVGSICSIPEFIKTKSKIQFLFFVPIIVSFFINIPKTEFTNKTVRIVAPNLTMNQKFDGNSADGMIYHLSEMSKGPKTDLIVWPETSYPYAINDTIKMPMLGSPMVTGVVYYDRGQFYNAMIMADEKGKITDKYFKSHLVPFGEYRPFGDLIPTPGQLSTGNGPKLMGDFVPAICYEIVFSDSLVPKGANPKFILNITNDAWFGKTSGPWQHLDMARRQAIETGLPVIRANNAGVSAIIDYNGRVVKSLGMGQVGVLEGNIPEYKISLYRKIGLTETMISIIFLCWIMLSNKRKSKV